MLKDTEHLKELVKPVIAKMQNNGLTEMAMKEPKGFFVFKGEAKEGYMPVKRIEEDGESFLICHK